MLEFVFISHSKGCLFAIDFLESRMKRKTGCLWNMDEYQLARQLFLHGSSRSDSIIAGFSRLRIRTGGDKHSVC
jgi:hypothetical protein